MSEPAGPKGGHFCGDPEGVRSAAGGVVWNVQKLTTDQCRRYGYGSAITDCTEYEDGTFWAGNGEYGSPVNFCPYCGTAAPTPVLERKT